jgi:hypothetical protein
MGTRAGLCEVCCRECMDLDSATACTSQHQWSCTGDTYGTPRYTSNPPADHPTTFPCLVTTDDAKVLPCCTRSATATTPTNKPPMLVQSNRGEVTSADPGSCDIKHLFWAWHARGRNTRPMLITYSNLNPNFTSHMPIKT